MAAKRQTLSLKDRPDTKTMAMARKAGFKAKPPKKSGAAKSEAAAASFATRWNAWVDRAREKAKEQTAKEQSKAKLVKFKQQVSGL